MANLVIKKPIISEKSFAAAGTGVYVFLLTGNANKRIVREQVTKLFKVKVEKVNIVNIPGKIKRVGKKTGQRSDTKKAYVKIAKGQKIAIFEEEKKKDQNLKIKDQNENVKVKNDEKPKK